MPNRYAIDKTLMIDELRLHYRDWGGRGWPLLLLHGLDSTGHIWDLLAPLLVEEARVIALDLRGHGLSDKPDAPYDFPTVGGDVLAAIEALELSRPVLVGHAYGARLALWIAARQPDLVSGIVLIDGAIVELNVISWHQAQQQLAPPPSAGLDVETYKDSILADMPQGIITPAVETAIMAGMEIDADGKVHPRLPREYYMRYVRAMWEQPLGELYEDVTCPVLMIPVRDRARDAQTAAARAELGLARAEEAIADLEVQWIEESIHDAPLQHPHRLAEAILSFLRERV